MNTYAILFEGTGINLSVEDGAASAIGFFATRWARAPTAAAAVDSARAALLAEWSPDGQYAPHNDGDLPRLSVEGVKEIGVFRSTFGRKPGGYSFYTL